MATKGIPKPYKLKPTGEVLTRDDSSNKCCMFTLSKVCYCSYSLKNFACLVLDIVDANVAEVVEAGLDHLGASHLTRQLARLVDVPGR